VAVGKGGKGVMVGWAAGVAVRFCGGGVGVTTRGEFIEQAVNNKLPVIISKQKTKELKAVFCLISLILFVFSFTIGLTTLP